MGSNVFSYSMPAANNFGGQIGDLLTAAKGIYTKHQMENELQSAINPDGSFDFNKAAAIMLKYDPEKAMAFASQRANADALLGYRNTMADVAQQKANQSPAALANQWLQQNGGGTPVPDLPQAPAPQAPQEDLPTMNPQSAPMELGPSDNTQMTAAPAPIPLGPNGPTGMPGASYATPSGVNPKLVNAPASVQNVLMPNQAMTQLNEEAKLKVARQKQLPTDWALVQSADTKLQNMEDNIDSLLTPQGVKSLARISGNRKIEGYDTRVPNSVLPDVSQTARDATAKLKTSVIEIGLNTLAEMRAASAQGASGMGQLAIQESVWLQNSIANLEASQSTPQLISNLKQVKKFSDILRASLRQKFQMEHGIPWTPVSQDEQNAVPKNNPDAMDMATEPPVNVSGTTANPRGAYNGPLPEGTIINNGKQRMIKQNGKWVPLQ